MDQDECAATLASKLEHPNFKFMRGNFSNIKSALESLGVKEPDAVLFDIGFSSMQIDDPARGFSFMRDGPLDMRMDQTQSLTAADIINWYPEIELAKIFLEVHKYSVPILINDQFGEELNGGAIARAIVVERRKRPIKRTGQLASLVERINFSYKTRTSHPATRTFQALRIVVNDEVSNTFPDGFYIFMSEDTKLEDRINSGHIASASWWDSCRYWSSSFTLVLSFSRNVSRIGR